MMRKLLQTGLIICVILLSIGSMPFLRIHTIEVNAVKTQSESPLIKIDQLYLEVEKEGKFRVLDDFIIEQPTTGDERLVPSLLNGSKIRINASYTTVIGNPDSIVIHDFVVEAHKEFPAENDNETVVRVANSTYNYEAPEDVILPPNSSKSEVLTIQSLYLPEFTTYKFVFTLDYHIYGSPVVAGQRVFFAENMSFELVENLPEPPYIIIGIFYTLLFILIAFVLLGLYGNRKYKDLL
jgi:hypothetical protein